MAEQREEMLRVLRAMGYSDQLLATFKDEELDGLAQATIEEEFFDAGSTDDLDAPPSGRDFLETLSLNFLHSQGGPDEGIVETAIRRFAAEARTMLLNYWVEDPAVTIGSYPRPSSSGEQQIIRSVELQAQESTLELVHDELLDRIGPALRQELDAHGCTGVMLFVMFSSMIHYF